MNPAIRVENLSKQFRIGAREHGYSTLRESLTHAAAAPWRKVRKWAGGFNRSNGAASSHQNGHISSLQPSVPSLPDSNTIWALKDVSFDVQPGEVVGIIGRNGAGKSTLLKVLSRITEPTHGRLAVRGRLASLLEVGTGFHNELTGRENIFLNGSILGMTRREIRRKFDDIVAFSQIDQFVDTPVKRYSSGMYVRLAFAVAAFLEPEILVIDEVLAVGDISFQKRCISRMDDLRRGGSTVLLVTHNMGIVSSLCHTGIILDHGRLTGVGPAGEQVEAYVRSLSERTSSELRTRRDRSGNGALRAVGVTFSRPDGQPLESALVGEPLVIRVEYESQQPLGTIEISVWFSNEQGSKITVMSNRLTGDVFSRSPLKGSFLCTVPEVILTPGHYLIDLALVNNGDLSDYVGAATEIDIEPGAFFPTGKTPLKEHGTHLTRHMWEQDVAECSPLAP
jgi:lipopolysaccharide transport system ATP-binding protein